MELKDMREMMMQSLCLMHLDHEIHLLTRRLVLQLFAMFCSLFYPNKAGLRHYF
jgi:hypothetical protein